MDWKELYQKKLINADEAAAKIKSGDRIVFGHAVGEPTLLVNALLNRAKEVKDVHISHMVCLSKGLYTHPEYANHFHHNSLFISNPTRKAIQEGRGDYTPVNFSKIPEYYREGIYPVDAVLVMVSPADEHGYFSLGVSVDYTLEAVKQASLVIAQVNNEMPRTMGESFLHHSEIDYFVEHDQQLLQLPIPELSDDELAIGKYCASLIEDGSTLQLGIGNLPDAVLLSLKNKKDLGIHTEMISDGVVELIEEGVITNKKKTLHNGKIVVTFLMGSQRLYNFVHNNPIIHMAPVDYVNDPRIISQNNAMISINSCVQVDLMGQVNSESVSETQISAVGGQADFVRGASWSKGGKSIIVLKSTARGGKTSKIVPTLPAGTAVTTPRYDVQYIITEYGIAALKGRTLRDRARALISVAHPDFRPELIAHYESKFNCTYHEEV